MTTEEYRAALQALCLTVNKAADLLGVDQKTSRRWAMGDREIPESVARLLEVTVAWKQRKPIGLLLHRWGLPKDWFYPVP
jgi:hypothetical protein